jgi:hypothetical protein
MGVRREEQYRSMKMKGKDDEGANGIDVFT